MVKSSLTATIISQNLVSPFLKFPGINYVTQPRLAVTKSIGEHGFAMVLDIKEDEGQSAGKVKYTILWDVGSINCTILHNFVSWERSIDDIHSIALSHGHFDHTGALYKVLKKMRHPVRIFAHPDACSTRYFSRSSTFRYDDLLGKSVQDIDKSVRAGQIFKSPGLNLAAIKNAGCSLVLEKEPSILFEDADYKIWTTGEVPRETFEENFKSFVYDRSGILVDDPVLDDQSLVIERKDKGDTILLLGCCHAGLINTMKLVEKRIKSRISIIIGGTHMESASSTRFSTTLQFLKERSPIDIFPVHCTGAEFPLAINMLGAEGLRAYDASVFTQFLL